MALDPLLTAVRFIHILAGVVWVGGAAFAGLVVARSLADAPPEVRGPAMGRIGMASFRFLSWAGAVTILFGIANQLLIAQEVTPPPGWHMVLGFAFLLSVAMLGIAGAVIAPTLRKMRAGPAPADAVKLQKRMMMASMTNIGLGVVAVFLMVYATKLRVV